jgi:death-on-curing protein
VKRIEWLSLDMVIDIHAELLGQFGGHEGLRDQGLLESALDRPRNKAEYGKGDLAALATAACFGLSRNHPFLDGNKRVAFAALIVFLGLNGIDFVVPEAEATVMMVALAAGEADEDLLARWVRDHLLR